MSRTLKWVLGILAVLVVICLVGGVVLAWQGRALMMNYRLTAVQPNGQQLAPGAPNGQNNPNNPGNPNNPFGPRGYGHNGYGPMNGYGFRGPMMRGMRGMWGFGPFGMGLFFIGGLFRLFIPLLVLVLVAVLFYWLGRRSAQAHQPVVARSEPVAAPRPPSDENPPSSGS